jgi:hypothetical protein
MKEIPLKVRAEFRGLLTEDKAMGILQRVLDRVIEYKTKNKQMENDARDVLRISEIADLHNVAYQCYLRIEEVILEELNIANHT